MVLHLSLVLFLHLLLMLSKRFWNYAGYYRYLWWIDQGDWAACFHFLKNALLLWVTKLHTWPCLISSLTKKISSLSGLVFEIRKIKQKRQFLLCFRKPGKLKILKSSNYGNLIANLALSWPFFGYLISTRTEMYRYFHATNIKCSIQTFFSKC